jgi:hypothetical protein
MQILVWNSLVTLMTLIPLENVDAVLLNQFNLHRLLLMLNSLEIFVNDLPLILFRTLLKTDSAEKLRRHLLFHGLFCSHWKRVILNSHRFIIVYIKKRMLSLKYIACITGSLLYTI